MLHSGLGDGVGAVSQLGRDRQQGFGLKGVHLWSCFVLFFSVFFCSLSSFPSPFLGLVTWSNYCTVILHRPIMSSSDTVKGPSTKFVSWNVRGLNHPVKRSKVFSHLNKLKAEVIFLQETHLCTKDIPKLKRGPISQIYHSDLNSKFRGAAILIGKNVQFVSNRVIGDKNGRFVIVLGKLFNLPVILTSIYAPHFEDSNFFRDLFGRIPELGTHHLILGGDFNTVLEPLLDRSRISTTPPT